MLTEIGKDQAAGPIAQAPKLQGRLISTPFPDRDLTIAVSRDETILVGQDGQCCDVVAGITIVLDGFFTIYFIVNDMALVIANQKSLLVIKHRDRIDACFLVIFSDELTRLKIPQQQRGPVSTGQQLCFLVDHCHAIDSAAIRMSETTNDLLGFDVPQASGAVDTARQGSFPIGQQQDVLDRVGVSSIRFTIRMQDSDLPLGMSRRIFCVLILCLLSTDKRSW